MAMKKSVSCAISLDSVAVLAFCPDFKLTTKLGTKTQPAAIAATAEIRLPTLFDASGSGQFILQDSDTAIAGLRSAQQAGTAVTCVVADTSVYSVSMFVSDVSSTYKNGEAVVVDVSLEAEDAGAMTITSPSA